MKHTHAHSHGHGDDSTRNIKTAFFLNITFTIIEIIGGFWTNSMAILSDALHDLGDTFSLSIAWLLDKYSKKKGDERYSFGYKRFSLLGALINSTILIAGSVFILSKAIPRVLSPEHSNAKGMLFFAVAGILVNGLAVLRLRGGKSLNERVVMWHLLEDVLGWVAVLIVSVLLLFKDIHILDPILSLIITLYVLYNVLRNTRKTFMVFLQGVPEDVRIDLIKNKILSLNMVQSMHHTHVWSLDGEHHVLSTHIVVEDNSSKKEIIELRCAVRKILDELNFAHTTVEVEYENESCSMREEA